MRSLLKLFRPGPVVNLTLTSNTGTGIQVDRILIIPISFSSFRVLDDGYNLNRVPSAFRPVVKRLSSDKIELSISEDPAPPEQCILESLMNIA